MSLLSKFKKKKKDKDKLAQSGSSKTSAPRSGSGGPSGVDQRDLTTHDVDPPLGPLSHSSSSRSFEEASEIAEQLLGIVKDVSEATELLSPLKSASALMIRGIQAFKSAHINTTAWVDLCDDMMLHVNQMKQWQTHLEEKSNSSNRSCLEALNVYLNISANVIKGATEYGSRKDNITGGLKRAGTAQTKKEEIARQRERLTSAWQAFEAAMNMEALQRVDRIGMYLKESEVFMPSLAAFNPRTVYGNKVEVCEEGTRTEVLAIIRKWAADIDTEKQIFWLNDAAGTGKSTIAATMAREWYQTHMLAGRFFFSPNDVRERTTDSFCLTMAEDIAVNQPEMSGFIRRAIKSTPRDHFPFDQQFEKLLVEPLQTYARDHPLCMIIDALDNCDHQQERGQLLELLVQFLPSIRVVKVFLTSRPVQDISDLLKGNRLVTGDDIQLLDIHNPPQNDITLFVEKKLGSDSRLQVEETYRRLVVEQSGGLFLYAATVCRMLKCAKIEQRPALLEVLDRSKSPLVLEKKMDNLYLSVLMQANGSDTAAQPLMDVLLLIIVAFQPISINTIRSYLPNSKYVEDIVQDLGAVLKDGTPDRPIKVLHSTFRDFLLSGTERARSFVVNPNTSHTKMAYGCLNALERSLHYNMLQLERPEHLGLLNNSISDLERRLQTYTTAAIYYASSFWVHHVEALEVPQSLWSTILQLLQKKLLNWVELASCNGTLASCIDSLSRLHTKAKQALSENPGILTSNDLVTIRHAHQFVVNHQTLLSQSALQAYCIPLFFTPPLSPIFSHYRECYRSHLPKIITPHVTEWGNHKSLGSHRVRVETVIFSPDGTRLMSYGAVRALPSSAQGNPELFLWDTETGAFVKTLSHERLVNTPIFSPDGRYLAFVTGEELHIHSSKSGDLVMFPLRSTPYTNFAFSPTQSFITVADGRSADLFDIETGQKLRTVDLGGGINTVSFSPDGKKICAMTFGASSTKISLWDWETFEIISVVTIHERSAVGNFSADGKKFSTWRPNLAQWILEDRISTVQLWKVSSKGLTKSIKISDTNICRVSFNPSSAYLLIQTPRQIKIWDCESWSLVSTITEAPSARPQWLIGDIHFSPDGQRLGVFLREYLETPAAFDVRTLPSGRALDSIIPDQISKQSSRIVPSADWTKVVSVIGATQLEIYDLQEGISPNGARNVSSMVFYFKVTPIGPILAVVDESRSGFQLWDVNSGKEVVQLGEDEGEPIRSMALSPNGRVVAETPWSRVFVWNVDTRQRVELPHGVESPVLSLNFSPNSELLAAEFRQSAGSLNLCVWNVHTQTQVWKQTSDGTGAWYSYCLGFSPDSSSIMSFDEHYIYIANINSKDDIYGHHTDRIYYIRGAVSPTGTFMAVLAAERADSNKKRIEIMEIGRRLRRVDVIFFSDTSDKHQLTFSGDGKYIACGPLCWDISSIPAQLHIGPLPPASFEQTLHSFLTFKDGWIHSAYPPGPLLPIPSYFQGRVTDSWYLCGNYAILKWSQSGPLVVDCSPWLARIRERI